VGEELGRSVLALSDEIELRLHDWHQGDELERGITREVIEGVEAVGSEWVTLRTIRSATTPAR
jgi:hypothetical protein